MSYLPLIPLLPALGALVNGAAGIRFFSRRVSGLLACTTVGLSFLLSLIGFVGLLALAARGARDHGRRRDLDSPDPCSRRSTASAPSPSTGRSGSTRCPG